MAAAANAGTIRTRSPDGLAFLAAYSLTSVGLVMIFSASHIAATRAYGAPHYFLTRQLVAAGIGLVLMAILTFWPLDSICRLTPWVTGASVCLLALVLHPAIGVRMGGSQRWIPLIGGFMFQPSELAKVALVAFLARLGAMLYRREIEYGYFAAWAGATVGLACLLILLEPDLKTTALVAVSSWIVAYLAGADARQLRAAVLLTITGGLIAILCNPYMLERLLGFFGIPLGGNPDLDVRYHVRQSVEVLKSGGALGAGLDDGTGKFGYLPACYTDSIMAVLCEELGLIGGMSVVGIFAWLCYRGFWIACGCPDPFGRLLACGLTTVISLQALLNLLVVIGWWPTTGVPLPFISYGGSSLVINLAAVGLLLNVSRYTQAVEEGANVARADRQRGDGRPRVSRYRHR